MVITTDLRLNEPRYASLPNIMKAKRKPLEKKTLADYEVEDTKRLKTLKVTGMCSFSFLSEVYSTYRVPNWMKINSPSIEPPARQGGGKVEDVDGMISKLKELGAL